MNPKQYRFYYHYYRGKKCLSVHWKGACYTAQDVDVQVPTQSKWRKTQPHLVIQGYATEMNIIDGTAYIK